MISKSMLLRTLGLSVGAMGLMSASVAATAGPAGKEPAARLQLASQAGEGRHQGFVQEISEQRHAVRRREAGDVRPFHELLSRAQSVGRGEYLGVEPDISTNIYRFKFMRAGANVIWVDVDGRTGRVLSARQ